MESSDLVKNLFKSFYQPTEKEFNELWEKCIFVFDTNTLLNLYRYPEKTRELFLNILQKIEGRIWIPYQVAFEYHKNLNDELYKQDTGYNSFQELINNSITDLIGKIENKSKEIRHSNITIEKIISIMNEAKEFATKELDSQKGEHPDLEKLKENLDSIIGDEVGRPYNQEELDQIYIAGEERYANQIPPGFKDVSDKKGKTSFYNGITYKDEYGDLVYWLQIIEKAKEQSISAVILISDDSKEDWIYKVKGQKKGIHPELMNEFRRETNSKPFYLYNSEQFIKHAQNHLSITNSENIEEAITDIKTIKEVEELFKSANNKLSINIPNYSKLNFHEKNEELKNYYSKQSYMYKAVFIVMGTNDNINSQYITPFMRSLLEVYIEKEINIYSWGIEHGEYLIKFTMLSPINEFFYTINQINKVLSASKDEEYSNLRLLEIILENQTNIEKDIFENNEIIINDEAIINFKRFERLIGIHDSVRHKEFGIGEIISYNKHNLDIIIKLKKFRESELIIKYPYDELRINSVF